MNRFAIFLVLGVSLASCARVAKRDTFAASPGGEPTPDLAPYDKSLAESSIPADATVSPCLPQQRVRLVSRADGKVDLVVNDVSAPTCAAPDAQRIYPITGIYVDPKYTFKTFLSSKGGRVAWLRARRIGAVLIEGDQAERAIPTFQLWPLETRLSSLVVLENRCREGGQTPQETDFLVAPLVTWKTFVHQYYQVTPGDCRTVASFLTVAGLSNVQVQGYLSLIYGTTRVAAYSADYDTADGVVTFHDQLRSLDAHLTDVEQRLPDLQALRPETWKPFVGWSRNRVRKLLETAYWEGLFDPQHLASEPWLALQGALYQVQGYFDHLADILHDTKREPGVPRAHADALARFIADERAFWQAQTPFRTVDRAWFRDLANLRARMLVRFADQPAPPAP